MASGASASTCLLTENKKKKTIWPDKFIYFLYTLIKCKGTKWNISTLSYMKTAIYIVLRFEFFVMQL